MCQIHSEHNHRYSNIKSQLSKPISLLSHFELSFQGWIRPRVYLKFSTPEIYDRFLVNSCFEKHLHLILINEEADL